MIWTDLNSGYSQNKLVLLSLLFVVLVISFLSYFFFSTQCCCPSCNVTIFGAGRCATHSELPRFLSSTKVPFTLSILSLRKRVTCQYCGTKIRFRGHDQSFPEQRDFPVMRGLTRPLSSKKKYGKTRQSAAKNPSGRE